MSDIAIRIENLGKRYRYGGAAPLSYNLRQDLVDWAKGLFRRDHQRHSTLHEVQEKHMSESPEYFWALQGIDLEVERGDVVGIVGRNGAGKSTMLKILSRISPPTTGKITLHGRVASLLEVGTGFHRELTGRENIFLNGSILGMRRSEITAKLDEIIAFAEVEKFIDTPVKFYSSGMYVRLAFAVAANLDPDILLVDEVLAVGDLGFQRKCMDHMKSLAQRDVTVLFVSHNMFAVKAMCRRAICLSKGRVEFDGPTDEAVKIYQKDSEISAAQWSERLIGRDPSKWPIRITRIDLLDEDGEPCKVFDYGSRMRVRLHYEVSRTVAQPSFNVGFTRSDNIHCCSYSSTLDGVSTSALSGTGAIELTTPPLRLVSELYSTNVSVWDAKYQTLYCAHNGPTFHTRHELINTHFGVFAEPATWSWLHDDPAAVQATAHPKERS